MKFQDSFNQKENVLYDQNKVEKLNKEDMDFKDDHKKNEVHCYDINENIDRMDFEDSFCEKIKQGHGDSNNENIVVNFLLFYRNKILNHLENIIYLFYGIIYSCPRIRKK